MNSNLSSWEKKTKKSAFKSRYLGKQNLDANDIQ